jgi:hypothetical protein
MQTYLNLNGESGVRLYSISPDSITVLFSSNKPYTYSYASAGIANVEQMKILAVRGVGLNAFINLNVRMKYVQ